MTPRRCAIHECRRWAHARGLCRQHYHQARYHGWLDEHPRKADYEPLVCDCATPDPDAMGECRRCRRLVVSVALARMAAAIAARVDPASAGGRHRAASGAATESEAAGRPVPRSAALAAAGVAAESTVTASRRGPITHTERPAAGADTPVAAGR